MKNLIIILFMLATTLVSAQEIIIWEGGTPGKETNWNEAKNWSSQQVPDEFSFVIIKHKNSGHNAQPCIKGNVQVAAIEIQSRASLTISPTGQLIIDGTFTYSEGLLNYGGQFINNGEYVLKNIDVQPKEYDSIASKY